METIWERGRRLVVNAARRGRLTGTPGSAVKSYHACSSNSFIRSKCCAVRKAKRSRLDGYHLPTEREMQKTGA
jgi:hypothetical protein